MELQVMECTCGMLVVLLAMICGATGDGMYLWYAGGIAGHKLKYL